MRVEACIVQEMKCRRNKEQNFIFERRTKRATYASKKTLMLVEKNSDEIGKPLINVVSL